MTRVNTNVVRRITIAFLFIALPMSANIAAKASQIVGYDAGVAATAGTTGAADPTSQGWTANGGLTAFSHGMDSTNGGWRITDGTSGQPFFYQQNLSATDATDLQQRPWVATWTTTVNADAVQDTGVPNGVDNYYSSVPSRQNNNSLWLEVNGAFRYILRHETDANGDIFISDGTTDFQITNTGNNLSEELGTGAPSANYLSYALVYDALTDTAILTDSLGGIHGPIATDGVASQDRVVWGASSSGGQGSTTWNQLSVEIVPEPASLAIWSLLGIALTGFGYYRVHRKK